MIPQLSPLGFAAWRDQASAGLAPAVLPLVLDVREPWEVQTASVKEDGFSLLVLPMREVPGRLAALQETLGPDHPMACLCHHGMRSLQVANYLAQGGFTQVVNLQGGIDAWSQQVDPSVPRY
ncbi:MAG: Rhodanese domain protein [Polaromonas sp.]|jgi:rhodanese-related sulfurtransferase|nr:Rhodanese domain protein [Polaromonas sp.]